MTQGLNSNGYEWVYNPDHPAAMAGGMLYIHRKVAYEKFGERALREVVHHIDGNRINNAPENIELMMSNAEHIRLHHPWAGGLPREEMTCATCGRVVAKRGRRRYCSRRCVPIVCKATWPENDVLAALVLGHGYEAVGRSLGVSGAAVKKRMKKRGLQPE